MRMSTEAARERGTCLWRNLSLADPAGTDRSTPTRFSGRDVRELRSWRVGGEGVVWWGLGVGVDRLVCAILSVGVKIAEP